jgi:hypothetical protein
MLEIQHYAKKIALTKNGVKGFRTIAGCLKQDFEPPP